MEAFKLKWWHLELNCYIWIFVCLLSNCYEILQNRHTHLYIRERRNIRKKRVFFLSSFFRGYFFLLFLNSYPKPSSFYICLCNVPFGKFFVSYFFSIYEALSVYTNISCQTILNLYYFYAKGEKKIQRRHRQKNHSTSLIIR